MKDATFAEQINLPQSSSCLYICQYCLVHLGDIARYRNQRRQAESFYRLVLIGVYILECEVMLYRHKFSHSQRVLVSRHCMIHNEQKCNIYYM